MQRYLGVDVHSRSCTICVLDGRGRQLRSDLVESTGEALVNYLKLQAGTLCVCLEEGEMAGWFVEVASPHVAEVAVVRGERRQGSKSDAIDARDLAERMRTGRLGQTIFKAPRQYAKLRELSRIYTLATRDVARAKNRLRSSYRRRGIACPGSAVLHPAKRPAQESALPEASRLAVQLLGQSLDAARELKQRAKEALLEEARRFPITRLLQTVPGMGPVRVAQLVPIVVTPHRFRTKRQFWSYCGFAVVTRSSADWMLGHDGRWVKARVAQTRGLNRNYNHVLKAIFKGAATTVISNRGPNPFRTAYDRLCEQDTKPNLAKLTVARKIAATVLAMWKTETRYSEQV